MITFKFSNQPYQTQRVIGRIAGSKPGPTVVLIGGMHGNEPSGVIAIQNVINKIELQSIPVHGELIGITGNLKALAANQRFLDQDLNRLWNQDFTQRFQQPDGPTTERLVSEYDEQREIFEIIDPVLDRHGYHGSGPSTVKHGAYFLDLHTTSAQTEPFIGINDQLSNRKFALQFPVPTVLGIEEYLSGPLLSYLNDFGPVALAFEAGQHEDPASIEIHTAFAWLALINAGLISSKDVPDISVYQRVLKDAVKSGMGIYEVIYRHEIMDSDGFEMRPGYRNFSSVSKGETLADDRVGAVKAPHVARIFMPLYQRSGNDGFFLVRRVPSWALGLSSMLRQFNFQRLLTWLPGVSQSKDQPDALVVNKKVARFLAVQLFHLLGYRRKQDSGDRMIFSRREIVRSEETRSHP